LADRVSIDFPDSVTFTIEPEAAAGLTAATLEFGTFPAHWCVAESATSVAIDLADPEWRWAVGEAIPPATAFWWRWRVADEPGPVVSTPRRQDLWFDTRFLWASYARDNLAIFWHEGSEDFGPRLADAMLEKLLSLELPLTNLVRVVVYESPDVLGQEAPTRNSSAAFRHQDAVVVVVPQNMPDESVNIAVHEVAHLAVQDAAFNCFSDPPVWLPEGLATFAEGPVTRELRVALVEAIAFDQLVPLRSLNSTFPVEETALRLWRAQSHSVVTYLIETYGWEGMHVFLSSFRQGNTLATALRRAYQIDILELEKMVRVWLGLEPGIGL